MKKKILISAIEVSGDMHAANLVKEIKKLDSNIDFIGIGSEALREQGVKIYRDLSNKSTVGFLEPIKHLFSFLSAAKLLKRLLKNEKPDAFFCIDGQGFHMMIAQEAKKLGIPVVYYIVPQEWLWGTTEGGKRIANLCDLMITIFPEAKDFYQKLGTKTIYNGHPLVDIVKPTISKDTFINNHQINKEKIKIAIFPGSRKQELKHFLPIFIKLTKILSDDYQTMIIAANDYCHQAIKTKTKKTNIKIILKENYNAMNAADFVICSTGTITLEAALMEKPIIAIYKLPAFSYWLMTKLLGNKMPKYKALPNMLAEKEIIPEIIQDGVNAENIKNKLDAIIQNPERLKEILKNLARLRQSLERENIMKNNAQAFIEYLKTTSE